MTFDPFTPVDEVEDVNDIDDMPNLSSRIGKRRVNKIKSHRTRHKRQNRRGKNTQNLIMEIMEDKSYSDTFSNVDDIIAGVSRLDHYSGKGRQIPLSKEALYMILRDLPEINTAAIMDLLRVGESQGRVYRRAAELCHNLIVKSEDTMVEVNDPVIESGMSDVD